MSIYDNIARESFSEGWRQACEELAARVTVLRESDRLTAEVYVSIVLLISSMAAEAGPKAKSTAELADRFEGKR